MCLRRNSMAYYWNYSKTFSNFVSAWIQLNANKKSFQDVLELSPSPNSFAWFRGCRKAFPKCVSGKTEAHHIEILLRHFKLCLSRNSFEPYWNYSKTFSNCLLAQIHLHGTKNVVKHFQILSEAKFNGILLNLFWDVFNLCLSLNSVETY